MNAAMYEVRNTPFNQEHCPELIGQTFEPGTVPTIAELKRILIPLPTVCDICHETDGHTLSCPCFGR